MAFPWVSLFRHTYKVERCTQLWVCCERHRLQRCRLQPIQSRRCQTSDLQVSLPAEQQNTFKVQVSQLPFTLTVFQLGKGTQPFFMYSICSEMFIFLEKQNTYSIFFFHLRGHIFRKATFLHKTSFKITNVKHLPRLVFFITLNLPIFIFLTPSECYRLYNRIFSVLIHIFFINQDESGKFSYGNGSKSFVYD